MKGLLVTILVALSFAASLKSAAGVIIDGPDTVIYHPGQGPVELTCNVTTEGVILWMINGFKFTLTQLANGAVVNHSNNGLNIVINVPVNNTEYVCVEALQLSDILSDPVFIYLAAPPDRVPGFTGKVDDMGDVTLSWGEPFNNFDPIVNYTVACSGDAQCPPDFTTTDNSTRSYTITNLTLMANYTFSVIAVNSIGNGAPATIVLTISSDNNMCQPDVATCVSEFYPFGFSENDYSLSRYSHFGSSIVLSEDFYFYNQTIRLVYISDNGIISLNNSYNSFTPTSLPISGHKLIAPYWADFHLRASGYVFYRQTRDPDLLARATNEIRAAFPMSQNAIVNLLIITWDEVGYYYYGSDKNNTLQCVLASTLTESFVMFLYADGRIQWTTGDNSNGTNGLGGTEALAGINAGDGVNSITIPGSLTPDIINITQTTNVGIRGTWMFKVGEGQPSPYIIQQPTGSQGYVGERRQMICSISVPPDVDPNTIELGWLNEEYIVTNDSRVTIVKSMNSSNGSSDFIVNTITTVILFDPLFEDDEGVYSCYAIVNGTQTSAFMQLGIQIPYPNVRITVPNDIFVDNGTTGPPGYGNLTIGDSLTLNCSFTTVRGISSPISFIWTTGDIELRREDYFTADVLNDTAIYTDLFTISSLSAIDNGRVYRCRVVINATRPVSNSDYFTVVFPAPVCFNTMDCEGVPVSDDSISFAQCCFGLSAVSFALPGQCSLCPTPSANCTIGGAKDVVFVIDASNDIRSNQFQDIRELVANITITLKLNSPESSVGVILFDNSSSILFNLKEHTNLSTLSPAINPGLPYNYDYRYDNDRNTAAALDFLLSSAQDGSLGIRNETSKIAIVITGGRSDSNYSTQSAAAALHAANIFDVYAIGFGRADINELNTIATDPNFVYYTYYNSYNVEALRMAVTDQLCFDDMCQPDVATCVTEFYPFGFSENDNSLSRYSYYGSSTSVVLSENFYFYDQTIRVVYISDNGIISLNNSYNPSTPSSLPINQHQFIAPYWADFDLRATRNMFNRQSGYVFYRQTRDPDLLARATNEIQAAFPMSQNVIVYNLLIVTWDSVGYYNRNSDKTNTLQCVLASTLTESFVMFLYADGRIQWTTGDNSNGTDGLGGTEALAGINAGDGVNSITIPGSLTPDIINITQTTNVGIPGTWMFKVGEGQPSPYIIQQPSGSQGYVGERRQIICSISVPPDVDPDTIELGWLNEEYIVTNDSRVTIIKSINSSDGSSNFIVDAITTVILFDPLFEDDEGVYSCYAIVNGTQTSTSMQLRVRIPYPYVQITVPNDIFVNNGTTRPPGYGALRNLTIGDSLKLDCSFTTVRGISSSVNFIWYTGGIELRRVDDITADVLNDTAIYTDSFEISSLSAIDNGRVYQCRVVINATRPVSNSDYFTVVFPSPVCFNTMDCEGVPVSDDSISFAQCCFGLSAVSFASPAQCSLCPTPSANCTIGGAKDVVFVIDASNDIGSYQFQNIRELVANITITLKLNSPESSVGVILFDNSASILFNLEEHTNLSTLSPAINPGLPYNYDYRYGNDRDTAAALDFLLSSAQDGSLGIRNETSKIAIVITGGRSDSNYSTQSAAAALHAANIFDVYVIGFGRADINELNTIASDPNFVYFTYFSSYNLEALRMAIIDQLCSDDMCQPDVATCVTEFYPFGFSENDNSLSRYSYYGSSTSVVLSENFYFYNQTIRVVYIGDNGIISLNNFSNPSTPSSLPISGRQFIAPYWADFDLRATRNMFNRQTGNVFYRQTRDPDLLARATNEIRAAFPMSQNVIVYNLLIVTWNDVGYYSYGSDKTNTLQCVLASTLTESFVMFLYADGRIQWTTGDNSNGTDGLGGTEALAGINAGDGVNSVTVPGSLTPDIINITQTSNVGIPGTWMFKVGEGQPSPYIFMQPAGVNRIYVGQRQQLICSISVPPDVDPDTIELGWLNEEDIVTDDSRVTINDSSTGPSNDSSNFTVSVVTTVIQFDPLFEDDEGNYSCYAIVNGTQTFTSMQLQVTIPYPYVQITVSNNTIVDNGVTGPPGYGALRNLTVGDPLTLNCSVTTVRGVSSPVNIIWYTGGLEFRRVDNITANVLNDSEIYTDLFTISSLSAIDNGREYSCSIMINATRPIYGYGYFLLLFPAPVCFNTMDCEGVPVSDDSISFAQCCFGLSAVSFALPGRCSLCPTPSADCTIGGAKDVVFVIDASNEIGSYQFRKIRELVANITITLKVNSPESSVGVILFNNSASILFNLEAHTNLSTLSPAINPGLPYNYDYRYGNDRDTAAALDFLLSSARDGSLGIRNETSNIAIVITGGRSDSNYSIQSAAAALHAANIFDVYAIGFGRADINELNTIASDPNFVYFTYYDFQELQMDVENQLCSRLPTISPVKYCNGYGNFYITGKGEYSISTQNQSIDCFGDIYVYNNSQIQIFGAFHCEGYGYFVLNGQGLLYSVETDYYSNCTRLIDNIPDIQGNLSVRTSCMGNRASAFLGNGQFTVMVDASVQNSGLECSGYISGISFSNNTQSTQTFGPFRCISSGYLSINGIGVIEDDNMFCTANPISMREPLECSGTGEFEIIGSGLFYIVALPEIACTGDGQVYEFDVGEIFISSGGSFACNGSMFFIVNGTGEIESVTTIGGSHNCTDMPISSGSGAIDTVKCSGEGDYFIVGDGSFYVNRTGPGILYCSGDVISGVNTSQRAEYFIYGEFSCALSGIVYFTGMGTVELINASAPYECDGVFFPGPTEEPPFSGFGGDEVRCFACGNISISGYGQIVIASQSTLDCRGAVSSDLDQNVVVTTDDFYCTGNGYVYITGRGEVFVNSTISNNCSENNFTSDDESLCFPPVPCQPEKVTCVTEFYPFGLSENDSVLTNVDDDTSQPLMLSETFYFYGQAISVVYVGSNGIISLNSRYNPFTNPSVFDRNKFIAPYSYDVDTRGIGDIYYRQTTDPSLIARATNEIQTAFSVSLNVSNLLIATWDRVGYYPFGTDRTNTFQCVLVTSATTSFVIFLYADGEIQQSNGSQAIISAGDGVNFITIPSAINITQTSNVDIPGVWMFQVDRGLNGTEPPTTSPVKYCIGYGNFSITGEGEYSISTESGSCFGDIYVYNNSQIQTYGAFHCEGYRYFILNGQGLLYSVETDYGSNCTSLIDNITDIQGNSSVRTSCMGNRASAFLGNGQFTVMVDASVQNSGLECSGYISGISFSNNTQSTQTFGPFRCVSSGYLSINGIGVIENDNMFCTVSPISMREPLECSGIGEFEIIGSGLFYIVALPEIACTGDGQVYKFDVGEIFISTGGSFACNGSMFFNVNGTGEIESVTTIGGSHNCTDMPISSGSGAIDTVKCSGEGDYFIVGDGSFYVNRTGPGILYCSGDVISGVNTSQRAEYFIYGEFSCALSGIVYFTGMGTVELINASAPYECDGIFFPGPTEEPPFSGFSGDEVRCFACGNISISGYGQIVIASQSTLDCGGAVSSDLDQNVFVSTDDFYCTGSGFIYITGRGEVFVNSTISNNCTQNSFISNDSLLLCSSSDIDECALNMDDCDQLCVNDLESYHCECYDGYLRDTNLSSCVDIDECLVDNGGCEFSCTNLEGINNTTGLGYQCGCDYGYQLAPNNHDCNDIFNCMTNFDNCSQLCVELEGSFNCSCYPGYELLPDGISCKDIDECEERTDGCDHNCTNTDGSYYCTCMDGYELESDNHTCTDIDECDRGIDGCQHACRNNNGSFLCTCNTGYALAPNGKNCTAVCSTGCFNGGNCTSPDVCTCTSQWTGNNCTQDIDECRLNMDDCDQLCVNDLGSYHCECYSGYLRNNNSASCIDIDECEEGTDGCDHNCTNTIGSYYCTCMDGYELESDNHTCTDTDECRLNIDDCDQLCVNDIGSYHCECYGGYFRDNNSASCVDINECAGDHGCHHLCNNTDGSFHCYCDPGYMLHSNGTTCIDIDECLVNNGGCEFSCTNLEGINNTTGLGYQCGCDYGYQLAPDNHDCNDINECAGDHGCHHLCNNTDGSLHCYCHPGYLLHSNGTTCIDIDECLVDNGGCESICTNLEGINNTTGLGYQCGCDYGYQLAPDNHNCNDILNCMINKHNCSQICVEVEGSFNCSCYPGYELLENEITCIDIDECEEGTDGCDHNCTNTIGSYYCTCMDGYELESDNHTCTDIDECEEGTDECDHNCTNTNGSYYCTCMDGYELETDNHTCTDIDECDRGIDGCQHACRNNDGSFLCTCNTGYVLAPNGKNCTAVCSTGCFNGGNCTSPEVCMCTSQWTGRDCRQDVDECTLNIDDCDQLCVNDLGSYHCECYPGYFRNNNSSSCVDINECAGDHGCHHLCNNTDGSFHCYCDPGYLLHSNGTTCIDINQCLVNNGGCEFSCTNLEGINNTTGLGYQCGCDYGYQLAPNNHDCNDILNCMINDHNCSQICIEEEGSFSCSCFPGYELQDDLATCEDIDECEEGTDGCDHNCTNTDGSYYCTCMDGYELDLDNHTCTDINECELEADGCQHICNNVDGSFHCTCNPGYTLNTDSETCTAQPCPTLMMPQNGDISCDGEHVTDTTCMFRCDLGYGLVGPVNRTCLPNNTWSGETTTCSILLCEELQNPDNGFVILPCGQEYGTTCTIECLPGYFTTKQVPVQICNATKAGEVEWTSAPICEENKLCTPNPCEHFGICNITGPSSFSCDCNGTGYGGMNCEIGIITTPDYQPLTLSATEKFTFNAYPDFELFIELTTGTTGLTIEPSAILNFSPTKTSAEVFITGERIGIYTIIYEISGSSATQFQQPQPATIIVQEDTPPVPEYFTSRGLEPGLLEAGSCAFATPLDYTCPKENQQISFSSTCRWYDNASPGIIFSEYNDLNLPVAITGTRISSVTTDDQSRVIPLMGDDFLQQCNFDSPQASCNFKPSDHVNEIENFLMTEALGHTFLSQIEQLIPGWLVFSVDTSTSRTHDSTSYMTDLVEADHLAEAEGCPGLFRVEDGIYAILKYSGSLNFNVNSSMQNFVPQGSHVCFAINLCEGLNSPLSVTIPNEAQTLMNSLPFTQIIRSYGWDFTINSIAISTTPFSHDLTGSSNTYWFGNQEAVYTYPNSTIIVNGQFDHSFSLDTLQINYSLDGDAYMMYSNLSMVFELGLANRWDGFMLGMTEITVSIPLYNQASTLLLTGESTPVIFSIGGTSTSSKRCADCSNQQGMAFILEYDIREGSTGIWSQLILIPPKLEFGLPTQFSCPINGFIYFDSSFGLQAISIMSTCIDLQLGSFPIMNLQNVLYISNKCDLNEMCDLIDSGSVVSNVNIYAWSMFPSNVSELRLGYFMSLLPYNGTRIGVASVISTDSSSLLAKLFQLRVSVLGTSLTVEATIDQARLYFNGTATIFGMYPAMLFGSIVQSNEWNEAPLNILGQLQNEFVITLQEDVMMFFDLSINNYQDRISNARLSLQTAQEQLDTIQNTNTNDYESLNRTRIEYNTALNASSRANQIANLTQDMVDEAGEELNDLRMRLDDLCTIRTCREECIPTVKCETCVTNVTIPVQGICNVTCERFRQVKQIVDYIEVYRWGWFREEICVSRSICRFWSCYTQIQCTVRSICARYLAIEPVYEIINETYMTTCEEPCQVGLATDTIESTCCGSVGCDNGTDNDEGTKVPEPSCVNANSVCERSRQIVFDALESAQDNSAILLSQLQEANRNVSLANLRVSRAMARLTTSETVFNRNSRSLREAQRIQQNAESAYQQVLQENTNIKTFVDLMNTANDTMHIVVLNVTFDVTIITESPTSLSLDVFYHVPLLNHTSMRRVVVDFQRIELSVRNAAMSIVEDTFLLSGRSRRSTKTARQVTQETTDSNQLYFEERCSEIENLQEYIMVLNSSISSIAEMAISSMNSVTANTELIGNLAETSMELFSQPQNINTSILEMNFNVTFNSTMVELGESETELEILDFLQNLGNISGTVSGNVEVDSYRSWLLEMQDLHNRTATAAGFQCLGFSDCLNIIADVTEELLIFSPSPIADPLLDAFPLAKKALLDIVQSSNITITGASENLKIFYTIISDIQLTSYYCAEPPAIVEQPPQRVNPHEDSMLKLTCNVSSDFSISYVWKRDEVELVNANLSTLTIDNIQLADSGNYTCEATNHIGTVETIEVSVEVQQTPAFFLEPVDMDVYYGDSNNATFQCNATGWPFPGFTWYFKSKNSDGNFSEIPDEVDNEYSVIYPKPENEGSYYCSASNEQGTIVSRIGVLTVLEASVTQLSRSFTVMFTLRVDDNALTAISEELRNQTKELFISLLNDNVALESAIIENIETTGFGSELNISFNLISSSIPYPATSLDVVRMLAPEALNEWATAQQELESWITSDNLTINSSGSIYTSDPSSAVTDDIQQTCPSGMEISDSNNLLCSNCPPGTYQTTRIDTLPFPGDALNRIVVPQCTECPIGYYQPDQGQISCDICPPGTTSITQGSRSCLILCAPNYYSSTGREPCSPCPQGSYTLANGSTACIDCSVSSVNVPTSICPAISATTSQQITSVTTTSSISVSIDQVSTTMQTVSVSPTVSSDSTFDSDNRLSDNEVIIIAVCASVAGAIIIAVLVLIAIVFIRRRRSYHDKNITLKSYNKSNIEESNHECVYPNPTYQDTRPANDDIATSANPAFQLQDVQDDGSNIIESPNPAFQDVQDEEKKPDNEFAVQLQD